MAIENYFSEKYVAQITSKDIPNVMENPQYMSVLFIYDILNYKAIMLGELLRPMLPQFKNYIKFFAVSCENDPDFCTPEMQLELPLVQAFIPKGISPLTNKLVISEKVIEDQVNYSSLLNFFESNIPYLGDYVDTDYIEEFLAKENNKLFLFSKEDSIINEFKALSSKYWGNIEFGVVYINQTELLDRFKIYRFPSIVAVKGKEVVHYEDVIEFTLIDKFVEQFKSEENKILTPRRFLKEYIDEDQLVYLPEFPSLNTTLQELDDELAKDSEVTLIHFFRDTQHPIWNSLEKIYSGAVKLINFHVKSDQDEFYAKEQNVKKFPNVRLFPSNRKRKSVELDFSSKELLDEEIGKELKPDIKILQDGSVSLFIESLKFQYKVGFLLISQGKIPVQIKGLAKKDSFKHFASFGYYNKAEEEAMKMFTINKFPSFIAIIQKGPSGGLRVLEYKGRLNDFRSLYYFVDELALPTLMPESIPFPSAEDFDPVIFVKSSTQFLKNCQSKSGLCAIALFDGIAKSTDSSVLNLVQGYAITRKLDLNFVGVDGACHSELLNSLALSQENFPVFLLIDPQKKTSTVHSGSFNYDQITRFINTVLRGKASNNFFSSLEFQDKVCISEDNNDIKGKKGKKKLNKRQENQEL